jgi:hypothetical protein
MSFQPAQEPYVALRTKALESLLIEKGLLSAEDIDRQIAKYEQEVGPMVGARVVARAWTDPGYMSRLLEDGTAASPSSALRSNLIFERSRMNLPSTTWSSARCAPAIRGWSWDCLQPGTRALPIDRAR